MFVNTLQFDPNTVVKLEQSLQLLSRYPGYQELLKMQIVLIETAQ